MSEVVDNQPLSRFQIGMILGLGLWITIACTFVTTL